MAKRWIQWLLEGKRPWCLAVLAVVLLWSLWPGLKAPAMPGEGEAAMFGDLSHSNVLIFGAGKMAELTARHLVARGVQKIYVANRHKEKAEVLAGYFGGEAVSFEQAFRQAVDIDVVVTSTGAPHYVVKTWETRQLMVIATACW